MRQLNRLILLSALSSFAFIACGTDDDDNGGGTGGSGSGTGGSDATGGDGPGTGGSDATGGNDNMGGGGAGAGRSCTSTTVASGVLDHEGDGGAPATGTQIIDDLEGREAMGDIDATEPPFIPLVDERDGNWVSADFLTPADDMNTVVTDPEIVAEGDNHYLRIACAEGDEAADAACNTAWSSTENAFQWAASSVLFINADDVPCYDASVFDGVQFKARAATEGQKIRLQFNTPSDMRQENNSFNSQEFALTTEWKTYSVAFDEVSLAEGDTKVDPGELESLSFVVRTVEVETADGVQGEKLSPHDIHLDDVAFFIE